MEGLTINEAAETTGWSPRMLRYLERVGLVEPARTPKGYRVFGPAELQRLRTLRDITAPLLRTSVIATWCFIFVGVIRELSAAIMLFTSETKVISVLIFDLNESGDLGAISVLGLIMLAITFAVVIAVNRIPGFGEARLRNA